MDEQIERKRQVFLDLDGVLADFDRHALEQLGIRTDRSQPDPHGLWRAINRHGTFFATIPLMADAWTLWNGVLAYDKTPIILTGMPMVNNVESQKREWVRRYFGPVEVRCTLSRLKSQQCRPGNILIDDWDKYAPLWEAAGGTFIKHVDAQTSLAALEAEFQRPRQDL